MGGDDVSMHFIRVHQNTRDVLAYNTSREDTSGVLCSINIVEHTKKKPHTMRMGTAVREGVATERGEGWGVRVTTGPWLFGLRVRVRIRVRS